MVGADNLLSSQVTKGDNSLTISLLLLLGADPNAANQDGDTPLLRAAISGRADAVRQLLEAGADANLTDNDGDTPLHLLPYVTQWSSRQHYEIAQLLLANGADVNARDERGRTPLFSSAWYTRSKIVWLLLLADADVNAKAENSISALHMAAIANEKDECRTAYLLLAAGADTEAKDADGKTPLDYYREYREEQTTNAFPMLVS